MAIDDLYDEDDDMEVADPDDQDDDLDFDDYDDFDTDDDDYDDEDDDYLDLEDASAADIDFNVALYREDGEPVAVELPVEFANDLDELIDQLRRLPGDAGACSVTAIGQDFFVICRVRGRMVQVLLNDSGAANDWPLARDVADYLGAEIPEDDDDGEPIGDFNMLADQGVDEFELAAIAENLDHDTDELAAEIIEKIKFGPQFLKATEWKPN